MTEPAAGNAADGPLARRRLIPRFEMGGTGHALRRSSANSTRVKFAEHLSSTVAANPAGVEHVAAIDEDMLDPFGKLDGIDERSFVEDGVGIEDHNVGEVFRLQDAAPLEAEDRGGFGGHLAHG